MCRTPARRTSLGQVLLGLLGLASLLTPPGCSGPSGGASLHPAPAGLPVEREWVQPMPQRMQQTMWYARMLMPDTLLSNAILHDGRLLTVEGQFIDQGFARRLRLMERDVETGRIVREVPLGFAVPEKQDRCRLIRVGGRCYIGHPPWKAAPVPEGILTPWPDPGEREPARDPVLSTDLPQGMAERLEKGRCFAADGSTLLVASILDTRDAQDSREWLAVAALDVTDGKLLWRGRSRVGFAFEINRSRVAVRRAGPVVLARASTVTEHGRHRAREFLTAFEPGTGRVVWSRSGPARPTPSPFSLVTDEVHVYVAAGEKLVEAWRLRDGTTAWRCPVDRPVVAEAHLAAGDLVTFTGEGHPSPSAPASVRPIAIELGGQRRFRELPGAMRSVVRPSFAVVGPWVLTAPDDRVVAWSLMGAPEPVSWTCWLLPGGLAPHDAAAEVTPLGEGRLLTYARGVGLLTLFRCGSGRRPGPVAAQESGR